jgi:hypothetical protein
MTVSCTHLDQAQFVVANQQACEDCLQSGDSAPPTDPY